MLQLSPCGHPSLQSELLSICKHVLGLHGSVAQASLLNELGLQPLQIIWLKACVEFFCLHCFQMQTVAMGGYVSKCGAVCGLLQGLVCMASQVFLKGMGVLSCEAMETCNTPDQDMVAQAVPQWAGSCRQQLLHAGVTLQNTYVQCFCSAPLGEESRPPTYLHAGLRIPHSLVLSMARFRLCSYSLGVELCRHRRVVWVARGCMRCAALEMHDLPVDDEAQLLLLCASTAVGREC
jgi:hypothetical protein